MTPTPAERPDPAGNSTSSAQPATPDNPATAVREVDLAITGMTCAACSSRVQKKLNRLDGVEAVVNLPLNSAHVEVSSDVTDDDLIAVVEKTGYGASLLNPGGATGGAADREAAPATRPQDPVDPADPAPASASAETATARTDNTEPNPDPHGYRKRLIVSAILGVPVIAISMVMSWHFPGWHWLIAALSLPVVTWGAWPFHSAAFKAARGGASTMDTLISVGVTAATLYSLWTTLTLAADGQWVLPHGSHVWFEAAVAVTVFLLAGRLLESRAKSNATKALRELLNLGAKEALLVEADSDSNQTTRLIPAESLRVGDVFQVRPGESIAADGTVLTGASAIDESMLTGEPVPVDVSAGSKVTGATMNTSGTLTVRADRVGADTTLAEMSRLVARAQTGRPAAQRIADAISAVFVPAIFVIALATLLVWGLVFNAWTDGLHAAITVLVIACPCALGLATPTALAASSGRGSQLGILVSGPQAMESARTLDTVVLDKTGTLTEGRMRVVSHDLSSADLLLAAAAEAPSEHPISRAIVEEADRLAADMPSAEAPAQGPGSHEKPVVTDFANIAGGGVKAQVSGHEVLLGTSELLTSHGVQVPSVENHPAAAEVAVAVNGEFRGRAWVADTIKNAAKTAVSELHELGLHTVLLTGDNPASAQAVADAIGIDEVHAGVKPEDKYAHVSALQDAGRRVAMVGDGVNDAAALAGADLGVAMGTGTDVAIAASDITLMRSDPQQIPQAIRLSHRTVRTIKQNLFWAFIYNVLAVPIAATGQLDPMIAGAAMAFSSVFVVLNSLRLLRFA